MSLEYITKVLKIEATPPQKLLLIILANYSDEFGESYPSHATISRLTGLSRNAVISNLKKLREQGVLDWINRDNHSNLYKFTFNKGGTPEVHTRTPEVHNTKEYTKKEYILDLETINEIYKKVCDKSFYVHSANTFTAEARYKKLKELARSGITSPKTGKKLDLTDQDFWYKYFQVANSDGHKKWIRSFWDKKPNIGTMLGVNQFEAIIERRYG